MPAPFSVVNEETRDVLAVFDSAGNLQVAKNLLVGSTVPLGSGGVGVLELATVTTVPTHATARGIVLYATAAGALAYTTAAGASVSTAPVLAALAADVLNATQIMADVTGLSLTITAGTWDFEFVMPYTGSASGASGIVMQLTGTPTFSSLTYFQEVQSANSAFSSLTDSAFGQTAPASTQNIVTAGTQYVARIRGRIVATAGGTLQPQFEANAAATTTTIKAGAYATAWQRA